MASINRKIIIRTILLKTKTQRIVKILLIGIIAIIIMLQLLSLLPTALPTINEVRTNSQQKEIDALPMEDIIKYLAWTNSTACSLTHDFGGNVVFTVGLDGQKAVCLDPLVRPERSSGGWPVVTTKFTECLVYSFGINNDWTFDEAMEAFGCRVYAFDPSMNATNHNHTSKIHFYNLGLGDRDETWRAPKTTKNWKMKSLDSIYYNLLKHEGKIIDYLKIDIEFSEWIVLPQILASDLMDRVRQLGVEIHFLRDDDTLDEIRQRVKILKSLEDYGLVRFDSKTNPLSLDWKVIDGADWLGYNAYEIFWYNSKLVRNLQ